MTLLIALAYIALGALALFEAGSRNPDRAVLPMLALLVLTVGLCVHSVYQDAQLTADGVAERLEQIGDVALAAEF